MVNNKNIVPDSLRADETLQQQGVRGRVFDAPSDHWVYRLLPRSLWPYAQLARWDRPIGWKLLMWPCFWSLILAMDAKGFSSETHPYPVALAIWYLFLFFIGAVAMRGAGCTWNDLVDQKIDNKVERTRSRPLPSGQVSRLQAKIFMGLQCLVGLIVLVEFNLFSIILGISSLVVVAIYPFMKRVTDWPQFFLGLAFNWGALMGWATIYGRLDFAPLSLYFGSVLWTIGYDTIYAHQDKEDDAIVGVHSTARLFGEKTKSALVFLYSGFLVLSLIAFLLAGVPAFAYLGLLLAAIHMIYQIITINIDNNSECLRLFKSNSTVGCLIFLGLVLGAATRYFQ
ncbi:4-hydroxybenzoate octaprenyltransferase [Bartonella apis]|uniref:4-hydroxybenzoate octaprenyltransferase n=1 Tax=Bartonella apis TaxID=1686310 RepID=UPI00242F18BB|nr:4-hydroxybenzoate octaprenyltransferase [Bartonella apis]